jgi:hypothetical protein
MIPFLEQVLITIRINQDQSILFSTSRILIFSVIRYQQVTDNEDPA